MVRRAAVARSGLTVHFLYVLSARAGRRFASSSSQSTVRFQRFSREKRPILAQPAVGGAAVDMHVLVTGAGGLVGGTVAAGLAASGHSVRGHDIRSLHEINPALAAACSSVQQGDLADFQHVLEAVRGVDAVVHLGGSPGVQGEEDPAYAHVPPNSDAWATILSSNVEGTRNIFEACAQLGVGRVVYSSRAGLLSPYPWTLFRSIDLPIKPVGNYSCSKAMGEALAFSYASSHPMTVVVVRIGNYRPARQRLNHPHQLGAPCTQSFCRATALATVES